MRRADSAARRWGGRVLGWTLGLGWMAVPAQGQGCSVLPDPRDYREYVGWVASLLDVPAADATGIDWEAIDRAYLAYLDAVEKLRLGDDLKALETRTQRDRLGRLVEPTEGLRVSEAWSRLAVLDAALLAATKEAMASDELRTRFARVEGLTTMGRSVTGEGRSPAALEFGTEFPLSSALATYPVPEADRPAWRSGVDHLIATVAPQDVAFREFDRAYRGNREAAFDEPGTDRTDLARGNAMRDALDLAVERGVEQLADSVSEPLRAPLYTLAFSRWWRHRGGGINDDWGITKDFVARGHLSDEAVASARVAMEAVDATSLAFLRERLRYARAMHQGERRWYSAGATAEARHFQEEPGQAYLDFVNKRSRERGAVQRQIFDALGASDPNAFRKRPVLTDLSPAQRELLAALTPAKATPIQLANVERPRIGPAELALLPHPWCPKAIGPAEFDARLTRIATDDGRRQSARAAFDAYQLVWQAEVEPPFKRAQELAAERESWIDHENHWSVATRQYESLDAALAAAMRAEDGLFAALDEVARSDAERASLHTWRCARGAG